MSAAAAAPVAEAPAAKGGGKKKLILIAVVALIVLALVGVGAVLLLKKKSAGDDGDEADAAPAAAKSAKVDPKKPPVYVPLEMFVVNLADREAERYAQVGVTLEIGDAKDGDTLRSFMPAVRSNILMVLAHKTSAELLEREGKAKLAKDVMHAAVRAIGIEVETEEADDAEAEDKPKKSKKKRKQPVEQVLPITAVHFSTFIVQ
jgi:flagellar protein FliL